MALLTRPLAGVAAVALVALGLLALLPDCAYACTCGGGVPFREHAKGANSSAVFSGEVIDVEKGLPSSSVTFQVSEVWKGRGRETVEVNTPRYGVSCGYPFKEGQKYLVYAYWGPQGSPPRPGLKADICTETKPLSEAGANLRVLGDGQSSEGEPLPDTSGGVAGLGVVGLAAVAAATAALLFLRRLLKSKQGRTPNFGELYFLDASVNKRVGRRFYLELLTRASRSWHRTTRRDSRSHAGDEGGQATLEHPEEKMGLDSHSGVLRVREALEEQGFEPEVVELERTARSAAEAADALGVRVEQIVKSLIFRGTRTNRPVLVLAGGADRVDENRITELLSEPVEMADAAYVREKTGFAIGGVPPVAHAERPEAFVDEELLLESEVWASAGHTHVIFGLEPAELVRLTGGRVVAVR